MKTAKILAIVSFFVLLAPAVAQVRVVKGKVPFDFVVGTKTMPAGEYTFAINGASALRITQMNGSEIAGIAALPTAGNDNDEPLLVFHRYGTHAFLAEVRVGEMGVSHRLYVSASELEYAKAMKQDTTTILAYK